MNSEQCQLDLGNFYVNCLQPLRENMCLPSTLDAANNTVMHMSRLSRHHTGQVWLHAGHQFMSEFATWDSPPHLGHSFGDLSSTL